MLRRCGHGASQMCRGDSLGGCELQPALPRANRCRIKLMVLPALALALRHAILWEQQIENGERSSFHGTIASGVWLGVGANLLVSVLHRADSSSSQSCFGRFESQALASWSAATARVLPFAAALALSGASLLLLAYMVALSTLNRLERGFPGLCAWRTEGEARPPCRLSRLERDSLSIRL